MRIGVDIDGVLNYYELAVLEYGTKYCFETGRGKLEDANAISGKQIYGWNEEISMDYWKKYTKFQSWILPARTYAAEVIAKLREEGHEIWIVTGRSNADTLAPDMPRSTWEETTRYWLAENGIQFDEMGFGMKEKGAFCAENQIDLMIEDAPVYLKKLEAAGIRTFIFDHRYNQEVNFVGAERVYSWYDIYSKIKKLEVE